MSRASVSLRPLVPLCVTFAPPLPCAWPSSPQHCHHSAPSRAEGSRDSRPLCFLLRASHTCTFSVVCTHLRLFSSPLLHSLPLLYQWLPPPSRTLVPPLFALSPMLPTLASNGWSNDHLRPLIRWFRCQRCSLIFETRTRAPSEVRPESPLSILLQSSPAHRPAILACLSAPPPPISLPLFFAFRPYLSSSPLPFFSLLFPISASPIAIRGAGAPWSTIPPSFSPLFPLVGVVSHHFSVWEPRLAYRVRNVSGARIVGLFVGGRGLEAQPHFQTPFVSGVPFAI